MRESVLGDLARQAATDPEFLRQARRDPAGTLARYGYQLTAEETWRVEDGEEHTPVPTRSDRKDKNEGKTDRAKGRMKEAGGALTGDKSMKREGRSDQRKGKAKEKKAPPKTC